MKNRGFVLVAGLGLVACDGDAEEGQAAAQAAQQAAQQAVTTSQAQTPPPAPIHAAAATTDGAGATAKKGQAGWRPLYPSQARASSFLKSDWNKYTENYHPNYAFDDDPRTAWVEGIQGNGEGEMLFVPLSAMPTAKRVKLRIRNGYQKSDSLLTANAAPRQIQVTVQQDFETRAEGTFELRREMGWQEVELALAEGAGLDQIQLAVVSVHPGSKYEDTCISDVEVLVDSEVPYNEAQEKNRRDVLMGWIGERVRTAAYFASQASGYPFLKTQFEADSEDSQADILVRAMQPGRDLLARLQGQGQGQLYKLTARHQIPAAPDGLYVTDGLLPYFTPAELRFAPASDTLAAHEKKSDETGGYEMWSMEVWRSNAHIDWQDQAAGRPAVVHFWEKTIEQGRGTYEYQTDYVVHYGDDGVLDWVYSLRVGNGGEGIAERTEELLTFEDRGGKLVPGESKVLTDYQDAEMTDYAAITRFRS